jgi:hypothetical protein
MSKVRDAVLDGRLLEAFGAGTGEFIRNFVATESVNRLSDEHIFDIVLC